MKVISYFLLIFCVFSGCKSPEKTFPIFEQEQFENEEIVEVINWRRSPPLQGWWNDPPDIRVCKSARVTKTRVEAAVRFWERLGYSFGEIIMDQSTGICTPRMFEILFRLPQQSDFQRKDLSSHLACTLTHRMQSNSEIVKAEIFFIAITDSNRPLMMEHEIGHALGWQHVNSSYHIMHPEYNMTGHTARGIHYDDYVVRRAEINGRNTTGED